VYGFKLPISQNLEKGAYKYIVFHLKGTIIHAWGEDATCLVEVLSRVSARKTILGTELTPEGI
jgi:hypothetical protein